MIHPVVRRELFRRRQVSRQAMNQRAKRLKEEYFPMTTDEAMYIIAYQEHVDLAKYLPPETVAHIRELVGRMKIMNQSQTYLMDLSRHASSFEDRSISWGESPTFHKKDRTHPHPLPRQNWDFIRDANLRSMLSRDYAELTELLKVKAPKSTLVLCGSILEAVLVAVLKRDEAIARDAYFRLFLEKKHPDKKSPPVDEWGLNELISVAYSLAILDDNSRRIASVLKDYRNLIHPMVEIRRQASFSEHIPSAMLALFKHILQVLSAPKLSEQVEI